MKQNNFKPMIGEKIQKLRMNCGLTVRQLATKAEITPSMVSNFENNLKVPGEKVIAKLATALDVTEHELLVELDNKDIKAGTPAAENYLAKLKMAESLKSEKAITLLSDVIDFCLEKEKQDQRFLALKDFVN